MNTAEAKQNNVVALPGNGNSEQSQKPATKPAKKEQANAAPAAPAAATQDEKTPALYTAKQIADKAGCSVAYVHAIIAHEQPKIFGKDSRAYLYSEEFMHRLVDRPKRIVNRRVKTILAPKVRAAGHAVAEMKVSAKGSLFGRLEALEKSVEQIKEALGI